MSDRLWHIDELILTAEDYAYRGKYLRQEHIVRHVDWAKNQTSAAKSQQINAWVVARIQEFVLWEFYMD